MSKSYTPNSPGQISVGDLVRVARWPHEHGADRLGWIIQVDGFDRLAVCLECGKFFQEPVITTVSGNVPMAWVRRIPPLSELGDVETKEEIHA